MGKGLDLVLDAELRALSRHQDRVEDQVEFLANIREVWRASNLHSHPRVGAEHVDLQPTEPRKRSTK